MVLQSKEKKLSLCLSTSYRGNIEGCKKEGDQCFRGTRHPVLWSSTCSHVCFWWSCSAEILWWLESSICTQQWCGFILFVKHLFNSLTNIDFTYWNTFCVTSWRKILIRLLFKKHIKCKNNVHILPSIRPTVTRIHDRFLGSDTTTTVQI